MNGKILAPRRAYAYNLLDNSDFTNPVNQRGQTSYTGGYTIDRWVLYGTDNLTINHGYITVSGDLYQYIPADVIPDGMYTVCACKRDGTIVSFSRLSTAVVDWYNGLAFGLDSSGEKIAVGLRSGEYVWAALYEGSYTAETLPPYVPRGYAAELAECQRYYYVTKSNFYITGYVTLSAKMILSTTMHELTRMRVKPTVSCNGKVVVRTVSGYSTAEGFTTADGGDVSTLSSFNVSDGYGLSLVFVDTVSSVNNSPAALLFKSKVEFFADL